MRHAKIVCTIGPASESPELLDRLILSGMNAARLNFSHGSHESHARAINAIRQAAERHDTPVAIIQDLQGPRIRVGNLSGGTVEVTAGQTVRLVVEHTPKKSGASALDLPVTYPHLAQDVQPGARILIDDGLIELTVQEILQQAVACRVNIGGTIGSHKGMNLPGTAISAATLTEKDREDLRFGLKHQVDYVALRARRSLGSNSSKASMKM